MVNKYENTEVNLGPFMNPAPHIIDEVSPRLENNY